MTTELVSLIQDEDINIDNAMYGDYPDYWLDRDGKLMLVDEVVTKEETYARYKADGITFLADKVPSDSVVYFCNSMSSNPYEKEFGLSSFDHVQKRMIEKKFTPEQQKKVLNTINERFGHYVRPDSKVETASSISAHL